MLDTTISPGQGGHLTDHEELHEQINRLEEALELAGNLLMADTAEALAGLPIGSNGQVLTADSTQPTKARWSSISSSPEPGVYIPSMFAGTGAAQINAMIDGAYQDEGGEAYITKAPDTVSLVIDEPIVHKPTVHLRGRGLSRSVVQAATDFGAHEWLCNFDPSTPAAYGNAGSINDITFVGPAGVFLPAIGDPNVEMGGVRLANWTPINRCQGWYFAHGLCLATNHNVVTECLWDSNYDGVLFPDSDDIGGDGVGVGGDQLFIGGGATHNKRASVMVEGSASMFNVTFNNYKFCFGPVGIMRVNGIAPSIRAMMANCVLIGATFESCGNAVFLDLSTGTGIGANTMTECVLQNAHWTSNNAVGFRDPGLQSLATCVVRNLRSNQFRGSHLPFSLGFGGTHVWQVNGTANGNRWITNYPGQPASIPTTAGSWVRGSGLGWTIDYGDELLGTSAPATGVIAANDLLEYTAGFGVKRLTAGGTFCGTALTASATTGDVVIFAKAGARVGVNCEVVTLGQKLYRLAANEHRASPTVNGDPIGFAIAAGGLLGGQICGVQTRA